MSRSLEFAKRFLEEAKTYLDKGDPVQASEKFYKASEEAVKALAAVRGLSEHEEASKRGRWTATLLFNAVERLSETVEPKIRDWWDHAWFLHVEGFHEARLTVNLVKARASYVESLVELASRMSAPNKK